MISENYKKAQRLIKEGHTNLQDTFVELMITLKKTHPELTHKEVMDLFKTEVEKFIKFHDTDRMELPKKGEPPYRDKFPMMKVPYGGKR